MFVLNLVASYVVAALAVLFRRLRRAPGVPGCWSWSYEILLAANRRMISFPKADLKGDALQASIHKTRATIDRLGTMFGNPTGVTIESANIDGVPAEWVRPDQAIGRAVVLYLHGGGYFMGSPRSHRHMLAAMVRAVRAPFLVLDYRLAPEHPCPAALEDALAAYRYLLRTHPGADMAIAGDSAGGGLALATLVELREQGLQQPGCAIALSPWADLTQTTPGGRSAPSVDILAGVDLQGAIDWYAGSLRRDDPRMSPVGADLHGLPPLLLMAGGLELLRSDSERLAASARRAGVDATLDVEPDEIHVYQAFSDVNPRAVAAIERMATFIRGRIAA